MPNRSTLNPYKRLAALVFGLTIAWSTLCRADVIFDSRSRQIDVSSPYRRIISLYGAHTENLFFLGAQEQIIGVSINDKFPKQVNGKQKFSYHDNPEKFIGARPDLILIRPMIANGYPQFILQLEKFGITIVSLQPGTIDEMYDYWLILGRLTGREAAARQMVEDFQKKIGALTQLTQGISHRKRVYFQAIHSRMKTFTPGAMPIFALETAGGINVAGDARASRNTNVAVYSKERILAKASQIDVFLAQKGIMNPVRKEDIRNEPGFRIIKAIKEDQLFLIDENIVSRPVPRLAEGIMAIGHILYPDIFSEVRFKKDIK